MQYHLKLCKALSYSGIVSASKEQPDAYTEDKSVADAAVKTGYFSLVGTIEPPPEHTGSGNDGFSAEMTVAALKEYAEANNIDLAGTAKKEDIIARIQLALNDGKEDGKHDEDDVTSQFTGDSSD